MNHVKGPTNTATLQEIAAIAPLAMAIGTEAFELQERQGQSEAVKSETLPVTRDAKLRAQYEALGFGGDHRAWWDGHDALNKSTAAECVSWLDEHYPDHANPGAYWPT
jgi:hypothetical protein